MCLTVALMCRSPGKILTADYGQVDCELTGLHGGSSIIMENSTRVCTFKHFKLFAYHPASLLAPGSLKIKITQL